MKNTKGISFKSGYGKIGFSCETDIDQNNSKAIFLNVLVVPDVNKPEHDHFLLKEKDIEKLFKYLEKLKSQMAKSKKKKGVKK